jgi:hypothetical protein
MSEANNSTAESVAELTDAKSKRQASFKAWYERQGREYFQNYRKTDKLKKIQPRV